MKKIHTARGIALYIAVLVTSIGLAIALGIADIYFIESRITRGLLPSFIAFFAADTGSECALYWHIDQKAFNESDPPGTFTIRCNNTDITVTHTKQNGGAAGGGSDTYRLAPIDIPASGGMSRDSCARVEIAQRFVPPTLKVCTRIRSSGQNRTCAGALADVVAVERTLTTYDPDTCVF